MEKQNIFRILTYNIKKVMKQTTLLIAIIAILTSCSKEEELLPVPQQNNNLNIIEETEYKIKISDFYQYHQDAYYIAPENNDVLTYTRYNLGEIKIAKDGTGYIKSNIMPNDLTWPVRPWGSSEDYNFIFDFTMTDYSLNNDTIIFDLYIVPCSGDTIFFTSTFKITPIKDGIINLEQNYEGSYWNRSIVYELEIIN